MYGSSIAVFHPQAQLFVGNAFTLTFCALTILKVLFMGMISAISTLNILQLLSICRFHNIIYDLVCSSM